MPDRVSTKRAADNASLEETDAVLVAAAVAGNHLAKQTLFQKHAPMVNRLARRLLGPGIDCNDLVQDAFVEALLGIDRLKNGQVNCPSCSVADAAQSDAQ